MSASVLSSPYDVPFNIHDLNYWFSNPLTNFWPFCLAAAAASSPPSKKYPCQRTKSSRHWGKIFAEVRLQRRVIYVARSNRGSRINRRSVRSGNEVISKQLRFAYARVTKYDVDERLYLFDTAGVPIKSPLSRFFRRQVFRGRICLVDNFQFV